MTDELQVDVPATAEDGSLDAVAAVASGPEDRSPDAVASEAAAAAAAAEDGAGRSGRSGGPPAVVAGRSHDRAGQPVGPVRAGVDADLVVSEVFGPTFQGEGPSIGRRAGFVRLGRCNLDCRWCDTAYTWDWSRFDPAVELHRLPVEEIVERLAAMAPEIVVVTGGEPLLQQRRLLALLEACAGRGWPVEIETNGTRAPDPAIVPLVARWNVSPKLANSGVAPEARIRPAALAALQATGRAVFKFVVAAEPDLDEVQALVDQHDLAPVWIMPEGTDPATLTTRARGLADPVLERGWNLTPRLHVLLWSDERGR